LVLGERGAAIPTVGWLSYCRSQVDRPTRALRAGCEEECECGNVGYGCLHIQCAVVLPGKQNAPGIRVRTGSAFLFPVNGFATGGRLRGGRPALWVNLPQCRTLLLAEVREDLPVCEFVFIVVRWGSESVRRGRKNS